MAENDHTTTPISTEASIKAEPPPLTTFQTSADNEEHYSDRVDALRLIADSVAQQRQEASRAVITHPVVVAVAMAVVAGIYQSVYREFSDVATVVTTAAGLLMAGMAGVGYLTYGYLDLAEKTGTWSFLRADNARDEDILLVTKYGEAVIGVVVLRLCSPADSRPRTTRSKTAANKAIIRAWTVRRRYRHKGVGAALLEEAITLCRNNHWEGPEFADDHANSKRVLPKFFQRDMDKREARARIWLEDLKERVSR